MHSATDPIVSLLSAEGLPHDFVDKLIHESDWSMVIKLHAVFEAVLGSLIIRKLGDPSLEQVVAHLDFNNAKSGKVAFARALRLV